MKNKPLTYAAFAITLLATGCKQSNQADEYSTPNVTNSLSASQQMQNVKETASDAWQKVKNTTTNVWADVKESMRPAANYTYEKKDDFVAGAKADLNALDQKIKEFSDKAASADDSVKNAAEAKLQDLQGKRMELDKKLDDAKNATQANWDEMKVGFQASYNNMKASIKQAWQWLANKLS